MARKRKSKGKRNPEKAQARAEAEALYQIKSTRDAEVYQQRQPTLPPGADPRRYRTLLDDCNGDKRLLWKKINSLKGGQSLRVTGEGPIIEDIPLDLYHALRAAQEIAGGS